MEKRNYGKWILVAVILVLSAILAAVAYPELKKDKEAPTTTTTTTTAAEQAPDPVATFLSYVGPEHHQWDYYYDRDSRTISVLDQFIGDQWVDGWGSGYPMEYAGALDGLAWDGALKDEPLLAMTFHGEEGFYDDFLLALHPDIRKGRYDSLIVSAKGDIIYDDGSFERYTGKVDYAFTSHQGKLIRSVEESEDFTKDTTYDYDGSGRLVRVHKVFRWSEENGGAEVASETNIIYDVHTIEIESNEGLTRKWMATLDDDGQIAELAFGEGDIDFEDIEKLELQPIEVAFDEDGYLVRSVGHNGYGIHSGITQLQYDEDHRLVGFDEVYSEEAASNVPATNYRELYYSHQEPVYENRTTSTTRALTTETTSRTAKVVISIEDPPAEEDDEEETTTTTEEDEESPES